MLKTKTRPAAAVYVEMPCQKSSTSSEHSSHLATIVGVHGLFVIGTRPEQHQRYLGDN